jgi:hypothetical protein
MTNDLTVTAATTSQAIIHRERLIVYDIDQYIIAREALRAKLIQHVAVLKTYRNALIADGAQSHTASKLGEEIKKLESLIEGAPA